MIRLTRSKMLSEMVERLRIGEECQVDRLLDDGGGEGITS